MREKQRRISGMAAIIINIGGGGISASGGVISIFGDVT